MSLAGRYRSRGSAALRWRVLGERFQAVSRSVLAYQMLVILGLALLFLGILVEAEVRHQPIGSGDKAAFLGLALGVLISVVFGQLLSVIRLREWVLLLFCLVWYGFLGGFEGAAHDLRDEGVAGMTLAVLLYLGPLFILCGSWSLRTGRALLSVWLPIMLGSGGVALVAQATEKIPTWEEGEKWQVWEPLTLLGLVLMVLCMLIFLASRERQSLQMWQRSDDAHLPGRSPSNPAPGPRLNALGLTLFLGLGLALAAGTASTAPFLWDLDPSEDGFGSQEGEPQRTPEYEDMGDRGDLRGVDGDGSGGGVRLVEPMIDVEPWYLLNMLLSLILMAIILGYRPIKRLLIIRHLRRPFWHVSATERITQAWRLVEIALADAGVRTRAGEPASMLIERARPVLSRFAPGLTAIHGLEQAAKIRDRAVYGLGLGPDDERVMGQVAEWAYDTVWERLGDSVQLRAMYRGLR